MIRNRHVYDEFEAAEHNERWNETECHQKDERDEFTGEASLVVSFNNLFVLAGTKATLNIEV